MRKHGLENQAIEIVSQALTTDDPSTLETRSAMNVVGYTMSKNCADEVFALAGFRNGEGRDQVGVVELHDCFAANEVRLAHLAHTPRTRTDCGQLLTYDALGLCEHGQAHKMVERGDNTVWCPFSREIPWLTLV